MPVQVICNFHKVSIKNKKAMLRTRQVNPNSTVQSSLNSNLSILWLCVLSVSLLKIRLKLKRLCSEQDWVCFLFFLHKRVSNSKMNNAICWNSKSSKILCLSRLSASFIKIQSKLNRLCSGQGRIWRFLALERKWLQSQLVRDLILVQIICKFHKDLIKTEKALLRTRLNIFFFFFFARNSKVNKAILPEFELVQDFIPAQVIYNFYKDPIKTKQANRLCSGQGWMWHFLALKGK